MTASVSSPSLGEQVTRYLAGLSAPEKEAGQQEVNRFARWYGWARPVSELTAPQVGGYAEWAAALGGDPAKRLEPVKAFLNFLKKEGLTQSNLAVHLRVRKAAPKKASASHRRRDSQSLSAEGYEEIRQKLEAFKAERPKMAEEIRRAMADKDFRENAPLDAAREQQGHLEARIRELEAVLQAAEIAEAKPQAMSKVEWGGRVTLQDMASGEKLVYMLVDPGEANLAKGKISVASPLGKAILGWGEGEVVEVEAPAGRLHYRIEKVEPWERN